MIHEKMPTLRGCKAGDVRRQGLNFTANQQKNAGCRSRCGIIRIGAEYTKSEADSLPVSEAFPHPDFIGLGVGRAYPQGWPHRFGGVFKPHAHSSDLNNQRMVFEFPEGIKAMKSTSTGQTAPTNTPDHHQAALVLRAQNHLALALFELRNNTGNTPTRKAMGLAYAAARSLSQVVGGAV